MAVSSFSALRWIFLGIILALFLHVWDASHVLRVKDISEIHALSVLPQRVLIEGVVKSPRFSSNSLVFELQNNGRITCYWRRVPPNTFLFADENVFVHGKIDSTPRGKLCVVEKVEAIRHE